MTKRRCLSLLAAAALAASLALPLPGVGASLSSRIAHKRSQLEHVKRHEGVLTTTIAGYNNRIRGLQGEIRGTQSRLVGVQRNLDRQRAELDRVRNRLEVARDRLERVRAELEQARGALAARLVEMYKSDEPDALTVVLQSDGFQDLLDRTEFLRRISDQDRAVTDRVRILRDRVKRRADELASLEHREQVAAAAIARQRDDIAATRDRLVSARGDLGNARAKRQTALASVRERRHGVQEDLASLEREQSRIQGTLAGAAGPIRHGSGRLIWPVNGPITGTFGEWRGDHVHVGLDISAPAGTGIRAADSGRVVLMAFTGGYGNYTCIQHTGSLSTCYAHQSRFGTSNGASVRQGQVIGYVGNTGHSFGAHLHFEVRINGSPVNPLGYL
jgi:murein DD-endopeptidase MepM/ murein hydrolase activator NlpD